MKGDRRSKRGGSRTPDAIEFARRQRATANGFAQDVWQMVRNRRCRGQKFGREYPIPPYTADFCCIALKLVIEIDGENHMTEEGRHHDQQRDRILSEKGYQVLRIPGYEVLRDAAGVRHRIESAIDQRVKELRSAADSLREHT